MTITECSPPTAPGFYWFLVHNHDRTSHHVPEWDIGRFNPEPFGDKTPEVYWTGTEDKYSFGLSEAHPRNNGDTIVKVGPPLKSPPLPGDCSPDCVCTGC